jgi:hypothetical protein
MTQDEIIEMAKQAGLKRRTDEFYSEFCDGVYADNLVAFAKLVAAAEREVCADIAENWRCNGMPRTGVANAIRARGEK